MATEFRWCFDDDAVDVPTAAMRQGSMAAKALIAPVCNSAQAMLGDAAVLNALFTLSVEGALSAGRRTELEAMIRGALDQMDAIQAAFDARRAGHAGCA